MLHYLPLLVILSYGIALSHEINHPMFLCNYAIVCCTHAFLSCLRVFHLQINCDTDETLTKDDGEEELQTRNPQMSRTYPHQRHRRHISPDEIDAAIRKVFNLSSEPHSSSFSGSSIIVSNSEAHFNSYREVMHGDQPKPLVRPTTDPFTSNLMNILKVQRNPDGKLSFVYDKFLPLQPTANTDLIPAYTRDRDSRKLFHSNVSLQHWISW
uniref:Uncharacterized protein n=1 Tax=Glossina pallidipes TaxID=7398 RepID=A0A1A9ZPY9_GLOPL